MSALAGLLASCLIAEPALAWCCGSGFRRARQRYVRNLPAPTNPVTQPQAPIDCSGTRVTPADDVTAVMDRHDDGTTFCFAPGTYRLAAPLDPDTGDALVGGPGVVINGAVPITGWQPANGVWTVTVPSLTATTTDWSGDSLLYPQAVYQQDLFMSDATLTKVGVRHAGSVVGEDASSVGANEYFVDYDARTITLGSDPTGKAVELATAPAAIDSSADGVSVRGLTIEKFAGPGIESSGGTGWTIVDNEIRYNHTRALKVYGDGLVARNFVHHNGKYGLSGTGDNNVFEANEIAFNNTQRFARSTESFWDAGATKFVRSTNLTIKNNYVHDNFGDGIWIDIGNTNVDVIGNRVERNHRYGINYEISFAGTVASNVVVDNGYVGIWINSSRDVAVVDNRVERNGRGILVAQQERGSEYVVTNVTVSGNTIVDSGLTGAKDTTAASFVGNSYRVPDLRSELWQWDSELVNAAGWKALGMDAGGVFSLL